MSKRICQIVKLKPSAVEEYKSCHAAVFPAVLAALEAAHIVDYSINYYPPLDLLIATMKYTGDDYDADMAKVAADPETQRWWAMTDKMQESFVDGATGSGKDVPWWATVDEVFRFEGKKTA
ncbi:rhamnose mutarotase [Cylindrobasidium torrendii FP15055 ss-10]|uniref:Rhamnose mutarotase n=1 Tax=Cylindrobasidium torrendii FP15055 ss-10 TaxID=1314674 RepID=A0A0D7AXC3_9AGAR|nr:rhamnose mutarotase [Cylindrobasidium torrendii FP15055 ss-10]